MSTVTPSPPPVDVSGPSSTSATAVEHKPSPILLKLPIGTKLAAQITGLNIQRRVLVSTSVGTLVLQPNVPLPSSGPIQLQIQSLGKHVTFFIMSVHNKPTGVYLRNASPHKPDPGKSVIVAKKPRGQTRPNEAGDLLSSTKKPKHHVQINQSIPQYFKVGHTINGVLLQSTSNVIFNTGNASRVRSDTFSSTASLAEKSAPQPQTSLKSYTLAAGEKISFTINKIHRPSASTPRNLTSTQQYITQGTILGAIVSASDTRPPKSLAPSKLQGAVLRTLIGPVSIPNISPLPAGTFVELEILQFAQPKALNPNDVGLHRLGTAINEKGAWPALQETVHTLLVNDNASGQQFLSTAVPRLNSGLTANILFFLFALRRGDIRGWLGDAPIRALERIKPTLLNRLRDDFSGLSRIINDSPSPEGRSIPIPIFNGFEIDQLRLWLDRQDDPSENDRDDHYAHFIVDINLSRFGRVQLDGFVREESKRFDLIVRTEQRLSDYIQNGIRKIFEDANQTSGLPSGLAFQAAPANFVNTEGSGTRAGIGITI